MAFIIKKDKSYTWPITISEPVDGGGFNDQKVRVKFKMLSQSRIDEIIKDEAEQDADILSDVLIGWDDEAFKDENGNSLAYNADNKDLVLSVPFVRGALVKGFFASIAGKEIKRKN
ncbi:MAG: phage tail assembly chaperone [Methylobacter sp.]|uniref:hypothetical protein n=1 Tax=Methylobacter sp. TaxID=2051955 RepID=UPI0025EFB843|nr:hypothetical protein [Methylobacter sp.]MCK9621991.1 phage tail assembly chaperone [Methylobacter sp.]